MICPHCEEIIEADDIDTTTDWKVEADIIYFNGFPVARFLPNLGGSVMTDAIENLRYERGPV